MTAKPATRCACCNVKTDDLNREGVCVECAAGNHYVHCKPATKPLPETPLAPVEEPKAPEHEKPGNGGVTALAPTTPTPQTIEIGNRGLTPTTINDLYRMAKAAVAGGFAPDMTPEQAFAAMQFGAEVGLSPFQSLSAIAVINGKPALYGDGARAIVEASGELEDADEWFEHQSARVGGFPPQPDDTTTAFCMLKRRGRTAQTRSFSVADAKRAGLWGKAGPWSQYPQRMLPARAAGFCRRDVFPDKLKGFRDDIEARDIIDVTPEPEIRMPERKSEASPAS